MRPFIYLISVILSCVSVTAMADGHMAKGSIARATFTSSVVDREPVDSMDSFTTASEKVYFFTELADMTGHTVTHQWVLNGETFAEVPFNVGGPRWRVYSSKNMMPIWVGEWTVNVVGEDGMVIESHNFNYTGQ